MRLQNIAQAIAQQVKRHAGEQDRRAGDGGDPPLIENHLHPVGNHRSPLRHRRAGAQAEKAEPGGGEDNARQIERQPDNRRRQTQRQNMADQQPPAADAQHLRRGEVIAMAQALNFAARLPGVGRPGSQG